MPEGNLSYAEIVARAKTASAARENGVTLPKEPIQPRGPKQPLAQFDVEAAKERAREAQRPRTEEDMERFAASL